jgi:hypothetical protein
MISEKIKAIISLCGRDGLTITKTINGKEFQLSSKKGNLKQFLITQIGNDEKQADLILSNLTFIEPKKEVVSEEIKEEKKAKKSKEKTQDIISSEEQNAQD